MKTKYLLFSALLSAVALLSGCISADFNESHVRTSNGDARSVGVSLDFVGRGRQVYPAAVAAEAVSYAESYPTYGSAVDYYSGSYYGRPVSWIDYDTYRVEGHRRVAEHVYHPSSREYHPWPPARYDPPLRRVPPIGPVPPHRYPVPPPYILPPSGSVTVVRPIYRPPWPSWPPGHH